MYSARDVMMPANVTPYEMSNIDNSKKRLSCVVIACNVIVSMMLGLSYYHVCLWKQWSICILLFIRLQGRVVPVT